MAIANSLATTYNGLSFGESAMDAIAKARLKLKAARIEVAEWEEFLRLAEKLESEPDTAAPSGNLDRARFKSKRPKKVSAKKRIGNAAHGMLSDGKSRHTRDILEALDKGGIEVGGKNKIINLSGILGRDGRFKNDRKTGWSLK